MLAGVSLVQGWHMNSLCVPRYAKEAIGAICLLQQPDGGKMTINVEYNQLDGLLRQSGYPDGVPAAGTLVLRPRPLLSRLPLLAVALCANVSSMDHHAALQVVAQPHVRGKQGHRAIVQVT
jgi:hypothetical protein